MTNLRSLTLPALATLLIFGCGSSSSSGGTGGAAGSANGGTTGAAGKTGSGVGGMTGTTGAGGAGDPKNLMCNNNSSTTCTDADYAPFQQCLLTSCGTGLRTCYGDGFVAGQYSGACGAYADCISRCSCTDTACRTACTSPTECSTCVLTNLAPCIATCPLPACAGGGLGGQSGGLGGSFGGLGGFFGGLGGASGADTACIADLTDCCSRASAALKSTCQASLTAFALSPSSCEGSAASFKAGFCP